MSLTCLPVFPMVLQQRLRKTKPAANSLQISRPALESFCCVWLLSKIPFTPLKLRPIAPYVNYTELGKTEGEGGGDGATQRGIVKVPIAGEVHSLDPSLAFTVVQFEVISTVFETLT